MSSFHTGVRRILDRLEQPQQVEEKPNSVWVPVDDLLPARFVSRNTQFANFGALLSASGLSPARLSGIGERPCAHWDDFIRRSSSFAGWNAMLRDARGEWLMRRLGIFVDAG